MTASSIGRLIAVIAAGVLAVVLITRGSGEDGHRFTVTVGEATNVVKGQRIREAGVEVGQLVDIRPAAHGRDAKLTLELQDRAWPLPAGSHLALRWGGTANFGNRYIQLVRGRGAGSAVRDGQLASRDFSLPVEFDELLATFPRSVRNDTQRLLREGGQALHASSTPLRDTLVVAPAALEQAGYVVQDLDADHRALRTLVRSADDVLGAVNRSDPGIKVLLDGAARTFDAIADETSGLQAGLDRAPATLRNVRNTLAIADETLVRARRVTASIASGVTAVRRTATPLDHLLATVRRVGPDATATLATTRRAIPDLDPLLAKVTTLAPQLERIGDESVDALKCIRPFTPDVLSFFSNWGDFFAGTDGKDKMIRAQVQNYAPAFSNVSPINAAQASKLFSGLEYGLPRPPGTNAGQPWFLPECGAGSDALDPNKDPEIRESAKVFDVPRLTPIVPVPRERGR